MVAPDALTLGAVHMDAAAACAAARAARERCSMTLDPKPTLGAVHADAAAARAADRAARERGRAAAARAHVPAGWKHGVALMRKAHHAEVLAALTLLYARAAARGAVYRRAVGCRAGRGACAAAAGCCRSRQAALLLSCLGYHLPAWPSTHITIAYMHACYHWLPRPPSGAAASVNSAMIFLHGRGDTQPAAPNIIQLRCM